MLHEDSVESLMFIIYFAVSGSLNEKVIKSSILHGCGLYDGRVDRNGYFLIDCSFIPVFHALHMRCCACM